MTDAAALPGQPRGPVHSGPATARTVNVLAPNPSAMTLDGTNTWIVAEPDSAFAVVIDPGPLDDVHLRAVIDAVERGGRRVGLTLLTHGHPDHAEGAGQFAELTGTKVRALDAALRLGDEGLAAGDVITTGGLELRAAPTPGHTADSLSFHLPADRAVLTGDTILGRGTTVVAHPDGRLGDYLDSLRRLRSLTVDDGVHTGAAGPRAGPGGRAGGGGVLPGPPRAPAGPGGDGGGGRAPYAVGGGGGGLRRRGPLPVAGRRTVGTGTAGVPGRTRARRSAPGVERGELHRRRTYGTYSGRRGLPSGLTSRAPLRIPRGPGVSANASPAAPRPAG
ncbi:Hydroxyacylglutathione hydrolase [Streptomyces californicus]